MIYLLMIIEMYQVFVTTALVQKTKVRNIYSPTFLVRAIHLS